MAILFATNDHADFPGSVITTSASLRRTAYVAEAFQVASGNESESISSWTRFPPAAGDVVWIHFQYAHDVGEIGLLSDGVTMFELYDTNMALILDFNVVDGVISARLFGTTTATTAISNNFSGSQLHAIDIMVDTSANLSVVIYDSGAIIYNETVTNNGKVNPTAMRWRMFDVSQAAVINSQYVSEFIVADENTIGMGVSAVKPNAVGNYSEWEGNHVETGDTSLATGASSSDVGTKLSSVPSPFVGPATSAFRALLILNKASTRGTIVGDLRNFVRIAATDYPAAAMGANETIKDRVTVWNVNPNTGIDWGSADIASVEIGIETLSA